MKDYKSNVIKSIQKFIKEKNSAAYFELICSDVFGDLSDENQSNLLKILKELESENRITINGDRICIKKSNLLIVTENYNEDKLLKKAGLDFDKIETDIGHGCQVPAIGLDLINGIFELGVNALIVGTTISEIRNSIDGLIWIKNKIIEVFGGKSPKIYYDYNMLISGAINHIILKYKNIDEIKLVTNIKNKLNADGYYSIQNYSFEEDSLEACPYCLHYFVFEIKSKEFNHDFDIVSIEMLSTGKIISYNKIEANI